MLDKLRAQFEMKENVRLFYIKTMDLHAKFNLLCSLYFFILIIFFIDVEIAFVFCVDENVFLLCFSYDDGASSGKMEKIFTISVHIYCMFK